MAVQLSDSEDVADAELGHSISSGNKNSPGGLKEHGFSSQHVGIVLATLSLC